MAFTTATTHDQITVKMEWPDKHWIRFRIRRSGTSASSTAKLTKRFLKFTEFLPGEKNAERAERIRQRASVFASIDLFLNNL